ncbi:O-antigen ligase family protein [Psychroserpens sp. Hel_I_66]|uniref:O-antigen ligase family protein n=1 Tax=Psychroserpens sp. Hel_I_66 TaxID=1250004 RepID=UPI000646B87B|nr:O-antigen ligase family protein [Psychroserpens sp. Hel_I_66]
MKIIRIITLVLIIWNIPSIGLSAFGDSIGSLLSYATISLLGVYYLFEKKTTPNWWIIILALMYFIISSFQFYGTPKIFMLELAKFFVFILGAYELVKRVGKEQLFFFLLLGSITVAIEALFFPTKLGRYSGFYLNPNEAGFICIYGYALVYSLKNTSIKLLGQFVFTLMGLLTFSRTFIVIWVILNIISLKISIKNLRVLGIGVLIFSSLIFIDEVVGLNNPRFEQLTNIVTNKNVSVNTINEDSRVDTWAGHFDEILHSPFIGNGYGSFSGGTGNLGVHNSYLMIIGEAGIIPFLIFLAYMAYLFFWSIYFFKKTPYLIMQTIALSMFLLTDHNFFTHYYVLFATMWIQYQIVLERQSLSNLENHNETECLAA